MKNNRQVLKIIRRYTGNSEKTAFYLWLRGLYENTYYERFTLPMGDFSKD